MSVNILIADDHFVVRAGTGMIIESKFDDATIDFAESYSEVIQKIESKSYDLIFLDINMPGSRQELMIKEILQKDDKIKILIFSVYEENIAIKYLMNGAHGYLNKLSSKEKIIEAVESLLTEGFYYSPKIVQEIFLHNQNKKKPYSFDQLTDKEKEIAHLLMKGYGNLEIANKLNIKMSTVSTFKKRIFTKLNVSNSIELYNHYMNLGNNPV